MDAATMAAAGEVAEPPPSIAERRRARRKALLQEHLRVVELAAAGREDKQERDTLLELAASLRRRGEELDRAAEDAEAWAAAHPPKKMSEARVAYFRNVAESVTDNDLDDELMVEEGMRRCRRMPDELFDGVRKRLVESKKHAQGLMREYEANGYIEHFDADDFGLPPNYASLLCGMSTSQSSSDRL